MASVLSLDPDAFAFIYKVNPTPFVLLYVAFIYLLKKYVEPDAPFLSDKSKVCITSLLAISSQCNVALLAISSQRLPRKARKSKCTYANSHVELEKNLQNNLQH